MQPACRRGRGFCSPVFPLSAFCGQHRVALKRAFLVRPSIGQAPANDALRCNLGAMNILSVRPDLVIVDKHQGALMRLLERYQIEAIPLELRHARMLGGGFHCVTADIHRRAES
jgi:N-dimethylarginine dimethylaminohydrolase